MNLVHTASVDKTEYKRKPDGKINYEAYVGLSGTIEENGLTVEVSIIGARSRYGHLDLNVTPKSGTGTRWVEYKNLDIIEAPSPEVETTRAMDLVGLAKYPFSRL